MFNLGYEMGKEKLLPVFLTFFVSLAIMPVAQALTDPTKPATFQQSAKSESLKLESILFGASRKVAVINGKALSEGDRIDNKTIIRISKDSVQVSDSGVEITLTLKRPTIRQEK